MKFSKLNNLLDKFADGKLPASEVQWYLSKLPIPENHSNFTDKLIYLYKLHDTYNDLGKKDLPFGSLNLEVVNKKVLSLMEQIKTNLLELAQELKSISSQNIDEMVKKIIEYIEISATYYTKYYYKMDLSVKEIMKGYCFYKFPSTLHELLDALSFSYIKFLKSKS